MPEKRSFVVATWNVNSLRMRQERLLSWLAERRPDVVCLQELKLETAQFPTMEYLNAGYQAVVQGQKTYNGVALLSRLEHGAPEGVAIGLGDGEDDPEARLVSAVVPGLGLRVMSVYVPNGQVLSSDKYRYKLRWLGRLRRHLDARCKGEELLVCGDFNVAPGDEDVYDPAGWQETVICHPEARAALREVMDFGLTDTLRLLKKEPKIYTFWDYRMLAFQKNQGLRIDHILATKGLAARCEAVEVDRGERKGKGASDHAPLWARFG